MAKGVAAGAFMDTRGLGSFTNCPLNRGNMAMMPGNIAKVIRAEIW